nr:MAG TPA: hypothetical protein [Caudoviricetes sp.]
MTEHYLFVSAYYAACNCGLLISLISFIGS